MRNFYTAALILVGLNFAQSQVYDTGSFAQMTDVSNNGVAVGNVANSYQVMWTEGGGSINIGEPTTGEFISGWTNVTSNGLLISGSMTNPASGFDEMGQYNVASGTWSFMGGLVGGSGTELSSAWGMSSDGQTIVGLGWGTGGEAHAVKWSQATGLVDLGSTVKERSSRANSVTDDGTVIVGWQDNDYGDRQGVYWKNGTQVAITDENGNATGEAVAITPDAQTIVGFTLDNPFIWKATGEYTTITHPDPDFSGAAAAITDDGKTVVGYFRPWNGSAVLGEGFIYTEESGRVNLNEYVASLGLDDLGITFALPLGISPNGQYIVGIGRTDDDLRGFVIKLPAALGTSNGSVSSKISAFPNPVGNFLHLTNADKITGVELYSTVGQKILSVIKVPKDGLDVSKLTKGTYILNVKTATSNESIKMLKK